MELNRNQVFLTGMLLVFLGVIAFTVPVWSQMQYFDQELRNIQENPDEYEALWKQLDTMFLNEDILTGKFVNEFIYSFITDDYQFEYVPPKYKKWTDFFDSAVLKF